jgi:Cu-Zn family superoxide dismutase
MHNKRLAAIGVVLLLGGGGAAWARKGKGAGKPKAVATADIAAKSSSNVKGSATFSDEGKGEIKLVVEVKDAPPGIHAVHIHEKGDCSSADGKSAGDHWNPTHTEHGKWGAPGEHFHLGDIGNLEVKPDGSGTITLATNKWTAGGGGTNDIVGHAIIVHGGVDDYKTQPTGNAGPRIGCGVITAAAAAPAAPAAK